MPLVYKQCFIQYQARTDGTPAHGYVELTPNTTLMGEGGITFNMQPIAVQLDADGRVDVSLLSNDNVDITPDNWSWIIQEKIEGGGIWWFQLTEVMPEPVDLRSLYPLSDAPPTIVDPGTPGQAATIAVGTTLTGAPGSLADVINSGNETHAIFDFTIPRGDKGDPGDGGDSSTVDAGTTTTGAAGTDADVVNSGTTSDAIFDFTIPRGDTGEAGPPPHIGDDKPVDPNVVEWFDTSEASVRGVANSGDTMTGPLILSGDATDPLGAATKQQLDAVDGGGGGVTDHGALTGLDDDDHTQYLNNARGDARYDAAGTAVAGDASHVADGDPHSQYLTPAEGDAAYAPQGHQHSTTETNTWTYDNNNTIADPSTGKFRGNNTDTEAATILAISNTTNTGWDYGGLLASIDTGDIIAMQQENDSSKNARFNVTGAITDHGDWVEVPVILSSTTGATISKNESIILRFTIAGEEGGGGVTDHGALSGLEDDDHTQYLTTPRGDARYLRLTGGTLSGALTLSGNPTNLQHAATKLYVDQNSGGGGDPEVRITRPNVDDRLVEQWNGSAWSVVGYDSGWRNIDDELLNGWTNHVYSCLVRRQGSQVELRFYLSGVDATTDYAWIPPSAFGPYPNNPPAFTTWVTTGTNKGTAQMAESSGLRVMYHNNAFGIAVPLIYGTTEAIPTSLPGTLNTPAPQ